MRGILVFLWALPWWVKLLVVGWLVGAWVTYEWRRQELLPDYHSWWRDPLLGLAWPLMVALMACVVTLQVVTGRRWLT